MIKNKISYFFLLTSLMLLIYVVYKSEIIQRGLNREYYTIYYIFSSCLIFASLFSFFLKKNTIKIILINLSFLLTSIYILEFYLIFYYNKNFELKTKIEKYEKNNNKKFDTRTRFEIYNDLKKEDDSISLRVSPFNFLYKKNTSIFPLSGISNSNTINCNENGYYSMYQSDRFGFNNPDLEWDNDAIEYVIVGDSFAIGECVNAPDDIASILRNLSKKSVINLGYSGNGPLLEYASLREYLPNNAKKIIWLYYEGNDLEGVLEEISNNILSKYIKNKKFTQNLKDKQSIIDQEANKLINEEFKKNHEKKINFLNFLKLTKLRILILNNFFKTQNRQINIHPQFKKILSLTVNLAKKNNSELYFVYLPEYKRYISNYNNKNYLEIKNILNDLEINLIDIHEHLFNKEKEPLKLFPFELYGHYNSQGYKQVGSIIYNFTK